MSKVTVSSETWARFADGVFETWGSGAMGTFNLKRPPTGAKAFRQKGNDLALREILPVRGVHPVTGVYRAAYSGSHGEIMRLLTAQGYGVLSQLDANGCSPLMYAVMADSKPAIEALMSFSAKKELKDNYGRTAVHYASFFGCHKSLKLLIDYACDWCPRDDFGRTSLHWAVIPQSTKCLAILLQHAQIAFEDVNPCDLESMTPVHCAVQYGRPRHLELLDQAGCSFTMVDIEGRTALHWTADHTTDETLLAVMTAYPPLLNRKDVYGMTALHLAASKGSVVVVETLLTMANIEIELEDATGRTPLHWGCVSGSVGVVTRLLQYGASETAVDKEGYTPLHCAVQHGHYTVVSVLTTLAVPTHVADNAGRTPLMWAAYSTQEIMNELLSNKKIRQDVNLKDLNGKTALHFASEVGSAACVESLLKSGAGANSQDNNGQTALVLACIGGHTECIKTLAAHKCDLDVVDSVGNTAAHNAILYCSSLKRMDEQEKMTVVTSVSECLVVLGFEGANFDLLNNGGSAAIHLAVDCGSDLLTEALLRGLANPNVQDSNGYTPLHQAVMQGLDSIVSILLKYNAHVSLSDNTSKRYTPLDLAIFYDQTACIELLKSSGALSQDDIKDFAATCIQSVYKGYRARKVYQEKLSRKKAVTVISAAWKGYKARKSYLYKVIRNRAATKIQTVLRGYRQRRKFADVLKTHLREKECKELIEDFKAHNLHNDSHSIVELITIEPVSGAKFPHSSPASQRERKMRLEQAMKLRKMCMIRETTWAAFRVAEEKRRIDKANRIESERLAQILQHSQDRRKFIEHKKTHTWTLRSQVRAAVVIQRAFRKWKASNELRQRSIEDATRQLLAMETEAARRIQIAWRNYRRHCNFIQQYYRVIPTAPTVVPQRSDKVPVKTFISPLKKSVSFTDNILITGKPRHKLNLTLTSGIKLVNRPFTTAHRPRAPGEPVFKRNMSHGHLVSPRGKVDPRNYNRAWAAGVLASPKTSVSVFTTNAHSSMPEMSMTARKLVSPPGSHVISPPKSYVVSPPRSHVVSPPRSHVVSPPKSGGETTESSFHLPAIVGK